MCVCVCVSSQDAILDFFGAPVRCQELLAHCTHMRFLGRQVAQLAATVHSAAAAAAPDAAKAAGAPAVALNAEVVGKFKLEPGATLPTPKWGKLVGWTSQDDAELLLGKCMCSHVHANIV